MTEDKFLTIVAKALDIKKKKISIKTKITDLEEWDSLGHLAILSALDKSSKKKISKIPKIAESKNLQTIYNKIKKIN